MLLEECDGNNRELISKLPKKIFINIEKAILDRYITFNIKSIKFMGIYSKE